MSRTRLRVNPHSIVGSMSRNFLLEAGAKFEGEVTATIEYGITLKRVRDMTRTYSQMHRTDKYSEHSSIIWPVWPNG